MEQDSLITRTHNRPPAREILADRVSDLSELLTAETTDLAARGADLVAAVGRIPDKIDSDEMDGRVSDQVKQVMACIKEADRWKDDTKRPIIDAGNLVMAAHAKIVDPLKKAKDAAEFKLTMFKREKAAAEKRIRDEVERVAREAAEAARKAAEAAEQAARDNASLNTAIAAEAAAKQAAADAAQAQKAADAKAADMSRNRGEYGSVSSLRTFWDFADLDRAALDLETLRQHIPAEALEKAVRSFIKAGGRELRGVRIFENTQASVR